METLNKTKNSEYGELEAAKVSMLKNGQRQKFQDEVDCLKEGKWITNPPPPPGLFKLSLFLVENDLLRVSGRL